MLAPPYFSYRTWMPRRRPFLALVCALGLLAGISRAQTPNLPSTAPSTISTQATRSNARPLSTPALPMSPLANPITAATRLPNPAMSNSDYFALQKKIIRWSDTTRFVMIYINQPTYLSGWQPWHTQVIKDAFAEWQHALDNRLIFIYLNEPSQADVLVDWWGNAQAQVEHGACGINQYQLWGKYLAKNDIYLSLHQSDGQPWRPNQLYGTALHEIGHMLGIREHSNQPGDMMYPINSQLHLSQRDINTMRRIYASKAQYTNPPGYHLANFNAFKKTQNGKKLWIPLIIPIPL